MTREEKRIRIAAYCAGANCDENGCPLFRTDFSNGGICFVNHESEADIDEMYHILFGGDGLRPNFVMADERADDEVNHPSHYTDGKIEVIDFIEDKKLGFHLGNAVKYIARAGKKDPTKTVQDLKKARWYLDRKIELLEAGTE